MDKIIHVDIDKLYLDPNNPRLAEDFGFSGKVETLDDIRQFQAKILKKFMEPTPTDEDTFFDIKDLVDSFKRIGFIDIDRIICRELEDGKYLVLEGKRTTSALKVLARKNYDEVEEEQIKLSLQRVPITVIESKGRSEKEISDEISILLGVRHHGSLLEWEPLPSSFSVYDTYMTLSAPVTEFRLEMRRIKQVASMLSIHQTKVKQRINTYLVYNQLKDAIDGVKPKHFSLIQAILDSRTVRGHFIEEDKSTYKISENSIDNFDRLCEFANRDKQKDDKKKLQEPKSVTKLAKIVRAVNSPEPHVKGYATSLLGEFLDGEIPLQSCKGKDGHIITGAVERLTDIMRQKDWIDEMETLISKMKSELDINDFGNKPNDQFHKEQLEKPLRIIEAVLGVD
jgi:hypothetical protein